MKTRADQIFERFKKFHAENPRVWFLFKLFTEAAMASGRKHYSADAVFHRIRWMEEVETKSEAFKLNDHYTSLYARLFEAARPEHAGFFRKRHRKSKHQGERIGFDTAAAEEGIDDDMIKELLELIPSHQAHLV